MNIKILLLQILQKIIIVLHLLIVGFVLFGAFCVNRTVRFYHLISCISLLIHWITNKCECIVSSIENKLSDHIRLLSGCPLIIINRDTFIVKLLAPIVKISNFTSMIISTIVIICLILYSMIGLREK